MDFAELDQVTRGQRLLGFDEEWGAGIHTGQFAFPGKGALLSRPDAIRNYVR